MTARRRLRELAAVGLGFALLAGALLFPATPGGPRVLGAEDLLYLRPPLTELKPPGLARPSNAQLADAVEVFRPDLQWARERIRSGELPLWSAGIFTGFPVLASQQTAILWPPNSLAYVLPFFDAVALATLLGLVLAALGAFALCRFTLRLGLWPSVLAGLSFGFGSYFVSWLEHPHSNAWSVMPWALVAADVTVRRGCRRRRPIR